MASAGLVVRDSHLARPALNSQSARLPSGQTASSSFSDIGIVLPSLHLGSFSNMTLNSLPGTPDTSAASSPDKQLAQDSLVDGRSLSPSADQERHLTADNVLPWPVQNLSGRAPAEYTPKSRRPSLSSQLSRPSAAPGPVRSSLDQSTGGSDPMDRAHSPSTIAGGSYGRMLPTPVPSTVASSQPGRSPTQEDLSASQQPRRRPLSLSSEDDDEQDPSFDPSRLMPTRSRNANLNGRTVPDDRDRTDLETGTPQLKVVNGQHAAPRRVESVDYATGSSPGLYESPGSWIPSPSSSVPYRGPNRRSSSRKSSPPPPRGAAPPDPSNAMYPSSQYQPQQPQPYQIVDYTSSPNPTQSLPSAAPSRASRPASQARPPPPQNQPYSSSGWQGPYPPLNANSSNQPFVPSQSSQPPSGYSTRIQPPAPIPVSQQASIQQPQIAQRIVPPEEVCIECMMRDRDMADVDVLSPGVWERESDVWYEELVRREVEEARRGIVPSENSGKPRARGGLLTEANIAVWLTMNPKEPAARWQTLEKYVKAQAELLAAESSAREATLREARSQDSRIRDTFHHVQRSVGGASADPAYSYKAGGSTGPGGRASMGAESSNGSGGAKQRGVKLRASTTYEELDAYGVPLHASQSAGYPYSPSQYQPGTGGPGSNPMSASASSRRRSKSKERDVTLLESGLIMERVDIQREEREERERRKAEEREERRRTRKTSRVSASGMIIPGSGAPMSDASSMHSLSAPMQGVNYGGSRSQISLTAGTGNGPSGAGVSARRMSSPLTLIPPRPPMTRGTSQSSNESRGTPRFFGFRHWNGAFGSEASLHHNSGSMMEMHLGLEQDQEMLNGGHQEQNWTISQLVDEPEGALEEPAEKDKRRSIGRLWKKMTGSKDKDGARTPKKGQTRQVEDVNTPLDPPPPLSYLVSRSPHERSPQRHVSSPARHSLQVPASHPRSSSTPTTGGFGQPPSSAPSISTQFGMPPSPTATSQPRYSPRDSVGSGEERRFSHIQGGDGMQQQAFTPFISEDGAYEAQDRSFGSTYGGQRGRSYSNDPYGNDWAPQQPRSSTQMGRPMSVVSMDKDLPPLPNGAKPPQPQASRSFPVLRPTTSYEVLDLRPPLAPFKSDPRRQSFSGKVSSMFGGSRSRLNSDAGLAPPRQYETYNGQGFEYGNSLYRTDEFGASTPSLRRWGSDDDQREIPVAHTTYSLAPTSKDKRASRTASRSFGGRLSAIFGGGSSNGAQGRESTGRRSTERENYLRQEAINGVGLAPSDGERYARQSSYPSPGGVNRPGSRSEVALRESGSSFVTFPRNSTASSRRYEAAIPQERDFVAMRYPTESERLNLMRQS